MIRLENELIDIEVSDGTSVLKTIPFDISEPPGCAGSSTSFPAGHAIVPGRACILQNGTDFVYASSDNPAHIGEQIFISRERGFAPERLEFFYDGFVRLPEFDFTPGDDVFLGLQGVLQQTRPSSGFIRPVGLAVMPDTILMEMVVF
jgi:hypothetical protein